jgi:hypothetical protein
MSAYRSGQCRSIAELYELRRLNEHRPEQVAQVIAQGGPITRATVRAMKAPVVAPQVQASARGRPASRARPDGSPAPGGAIELRRKGRAEAHCSALEAIIDEMKRAESQDLAYLRQRLAGLVER